MSKKPRVNYALTSGSATKVVSMLSQLVRVVQAAPIVSHTKTAAAPMTREQFYVNLFTSAFLVLAGGVFAGLTLGLMGQDEVYLKVIATSGEPKERQHARKVLRLIGRGKHWVLVTLLLCNVITNETLPIVLDRCLGGGWPAVVASTALIVIFGEIIPQSICVRYGLQVGSVLAPFVLVLMYVMYPVAYPCALLLDHILGEDHGTVYKKSGLKTLVTLHRTMGVERLNQDEVTIISAVLDLKEKCVADIMTPMDRVYTMPSDAILDEKTVEEIFNAGFSRIPIYLPNEPFNFIGMLLVRVLISYDPEDALPVALFPLATLPETGPDTSCLNILNYFQEGKSHMIVVSESPGDPTGALGVLTLEDVIEELIGEEIVDESDVYIDINKNIKRKHPGPLSKRNLTAYLHNLYQQSAPSSKRNSLEEGAPASHVPVSSSPGRLRSSTLGSPMLAPVNPASNPLETSRAFVKIKRPNQIHPESPQQNPALKQTLPPPDRNLPAGGHYDSIYATEDGAIQEAKDRMREEALTGPDPDRVFKKQHETDVTDINENGSNGHIKNGRRPSHVEPISITEFLESRSYRTGGIVESVVNVQGVHKTIIEDFSESDTSDVEYGSNSNSFHKNRYSSGDEESQRLMHF